MKTYIPVLLASLLLSACANPYAKFYQGLDDVRTRPNYVASSEPLKLHSSNDFDRDAKALMQQGYVVIGESNFNAAANSVSESQLREHAAKIGAHLVLVSSKYSHSLSGAIPMTTPTTTTSYTTGSATAYGPGGPVTAYGQGTTTSYGTQTTYIPYTVHRADFAAVFFAKAKTRVGFYTRALDDDTRRRLERNSGAEVTVVVDGSPAFDADILPGDVVISFEGQVIRSPEHYSELLLAYRGTSAELIILRDGRRLTKRVQVLSY